MDHEGGEVMQQFEADDPMDTLTTEVQRDVRYPVRAQGDYSVPTNPWPRDPEKEKRDVAGVQKRKPYVHRGQGNLCDRHVSPLRQLLRRRTSRVSK